MENLRMKNVLILMLMLLMLPLRAAGIPLPEGTPGRPVQDAEDEITDEGADAATAPAPTAAAETEAPAATPAPAASAAPQRDYDGSLFGEPYTDF